MVSLSIIVLHSASVGLQPHRTRGRHQPHPRREHQHNVDPGARLTRTQEDRNCHFVDFEDLNISELYQELRDELGRVDKFLEPKDLQN